MAFGEELPKVGWAQDLIGDDPDVYEEFDVRIGRGRLGPGVELVALVDREPTKRRAHVLRTGTPCSASSRLSAA